jgi:hypothetical protein
MRSTVSLKGMFPLVDPPQPHPGRPGQGCTSRVAGAWMIGFCGVARETASHYSARLSLPVRFCASLTYDAAKRLLLASRLWNGSLAAASRSPHPDIANFRLSRAVHARFNQMIFTGAADRNTIAQPCYFGNTLPLESANFLRRWALYPSLRPRISIPRAPTRPPGSRRLSQIDNLCRFCPGYRDSWPRTISRCNP